MRRDILLREYLQLSFHLHCEIINRMELWSSFGLASCQQSGFFFLVFSFYRLIFSCSNRVSCGFIRWINSTAVIDAALELPCAPTCCIQRGEVIVADFDDNGSLVSDSATFLAKLSHHNHSQDLFIGGVTDSGSYSSVVLSYNGTSFVDSTPLFFPLGLISGDFLNAAWNERDNSLFVQALDTATSTIVGAYYTFDESTSSFVDNTLSFTSFLYGGCLQW